MQSNKQILFLLVLCQFLSSHFVFGQISIEKLKTYYNSLSNSNDIYLEEPQEIYTDHKNAGKILSEIAKHTSDTIDNIRRRSFDMIRMLGTHTTVRSTQQQAIELLLAGITDQNSAIATNIIESLAQFKKDNFTFAFKRKIFQVIDEPKVNHTSLVKLIGFLDLFDVQGKLNDMLKSETDLETRWALRIALCRMNNPESTSYVLRKIKALPVDDDFLNRQLPDLIYTRNKEVFKFFEAIIFSDAADCSSPNPRIRKNIPCAHDVINAIAPLINGFPIKVDSDGEPIMTDGAKNLEVARAWLRANPHYEIMKDTF